MWALAPSQTIRPPEEGHYVPGGGEAEAQHQWILRRVGELIEIGWIEATLEANPACVRSAWEWDRAAVGEGPIGARDQDSSGPLGGLPGEASLPAPMPP